MRENNIFNYSIQFLYRVFVFFLIFFLLMIVFVIIAQLLYKNQPNNPFVSLGLPILAMYFSFKLTKMYFKRKQTKQKKPPKIKRKKLNEEKVKCVEKYIEEFANTQNESFVNDITNCVEDEKTKKDIIEAALSSYIDKALEDGLLDENEERTIITVSEKYDIDLNQIEDLHKAKVLYEIVNGKIPEVEVKGVLPVLLKKDEKVVWIFQNVGLAKVVKRTKYVGGSDGISIRIAKGVYYRKNAFKGHRITETSKEIVDHGMLIITNKTIFFVGDNEKLKFPINQLVTIEPYEDGVVIQKSGNAKPVTFIGLDGWYTYNLVTNLYNFT